MERLCILCEAFYGFVVHYLSSPIFHFNKTYINFLLTRRLA